MTFKRAAYVAPMLIAAPAFADAPNVVTDFTPVQAVVAAVMEGVGTPESILQAGDDPHHFAMRPSHARKLADADIVIWTGAALTPWLEGPIENLSEGSITLELLTTEGWEPLELRIEHSHDHDDHDDHDHEKEDEHAHDDHDHDDHDDHEHDHEEAKADDHDDHGHDDHGHEDQDHAEAKEDDHDDHAHDDHDHEDAKADDHDDHGHDDHDDHGHDEAGLGTDPHAWLDPAVVAVWAGTIADLLAAEDPDHADTYLANAAAFAADMEGLKAEVADILDGTDGSGLIFSHDAAQYFENAFDIAPMDYIAASDAADAGPAHLRELREAVEAGAVTCVFSDMESNPGTIATLIEGTDAGTANLDLTNNAGSDYPTMIKALATTIATCSS